ncbi:MAG: sulfotransferase domain-containing protein [Rhodospirillaceae bacterium]|nr:sulfotransferase domain-containing protein [Rhodospirillaceae bacterium]
MGQVLPQREIHYSNNNSDSARWDHFTGRDSDIFVCTPPRSGTTWTQTLCCLLLFGWHDFTVKPSDVSPWYDFNLDPVEAVNALLNAQDHRRLIKTHTPLDGIPYNPRPTYVAVHRDPRDVFFSVRNHLDNFQRSAFTLDPDEALSAPFREWVRPPARNDAGASTSMEVIINHFKSYKRFEHLANIHLFNYGDMKRDLPAAVARLAHVLGIEVTEDDIGQIAQIAGFQNMRDNAAQFTPHADAGIWKSDENFFNKGTSGQWRDVLSAEDLALYDERLGTLLPPEDAVWLHHGASQ